MNGTSQVPPTPGAPPAKKGMSPLAWIGIGCVVLLVLCGIAFSLVAYMGTRALSRFAKHPSITLKDENGKPVTINGGKDGKFEIKTDQGTATVDTSSGNGVNIQATDEKGQKSTMTLGGAGTPQNLPSWLPVYPGGSVQGTYDTTNAEGRSAAFTVTSKDDSAKVLAYYESQFKSAGLKIDKTNYNTNGQTGGSVVGKSDDGKREATVNVSTSADGTHALVAFQEKK